MAVIKAFECIRPDEKVADRVAALPYDVYNREEALKEVEREPLSFLAIDRAETQFDSSVAISTASENELDLALELLAAQSKASVIYLVDSYGSLYPEQIRRLADKYIRIAEKYGKRVGIHAHNNQQLAFANTIEACTIGVSYLDVTMSGMGRGAGNCYTELLMGFLRNPKYRISPVLKFIENHMVPLKKAGVVWGCDVQYMITGNANQHPRTAIAFTGEGRTDYDNFYTQITSYE